MRKDKTKTRINNQIRAKEVRLIDENGTQLGILPIKEAIDKAKDKNEDLVEVAPDADPPVCRIMDYGKYRYQMTKKKAKSRKHQKQIQVKEMKFRPKTDEHDFKFKLNHIIRFLEKGNMVKVHVHFRGREITHDALGRELLDRVVEELKDYAQVEGKPKMEGRNMTMMLAPRRD